MEKKTSVHPPFTKSYRQPPVNSSPFKKCPSRSSKEYSRPAPGPYKKGHYLSKEKAKKPVIWGEGETETKNCEAALQVEGGCLSSLFKPGWSCQGFAQKESRDSRPYSPCKNVGTRTLRIRGIFPMQKVSWQSLGLAEKLGKFGVWLRS